MEYVLKMLEATPRDCPYQTCFRRLQFIFCSDDGKRNVLSDIVKKQFEFKIV